MIFDIWINENQDTLRKPRAPSVYIYISLSLSLALSHGRVSARLAPPGATEKLWHLPVRVASSGRIWFIWDLQQEPGFAEGDSWLKIYWRFNLLFVCSFGKSKINHPEFVADRCVYPYLGLNGGHQSSDFLRVWLAMWNVDGNTMTESAPIFVVSSCGLFGVLKQAEGVARIDFCSFLTI